MRQTCVLVQVRNATRTSTYLFLAAMTLLLHEPRQPVILLFQRVQLKRVILQRHRQLVVGLFNHINLLLQRARLLLVLIALTAHAMASDREKALAAGCEDYDTKPIELPRLLEKIETLLKAKRAHA